MNSPTRLTKLPARNLKVLREIHDRLANTDCLWVLTGSTSFALQGVPVQPNDIDVQTDRAGAYELERLFSAQVVRPVRFSEAKRIRSHFGVLLIDDVKVEIMGDIQKRDAYGDWDQPADLVHNRRFVEMDGMRLPVLSIEYESEAYLKLGRIEKAEMLRKWLEKN